MKRLFLFLLVSIAALAQDAPPTFNPGGNGGTIQYVQTAPSGACGYFPVLPIQMLTGIIYTCKNGVWAPQGGGGGGSNFTALSGDAISTATGGNTQVVGLLGNPLPPLAIGYLRWTGSAWLLSPAGGNGFPITLGSTSIAAGSTTATLSGLTLVAPALGTPTAVNLTNATGLPWSGLTGSPSTSQVPVQSLTTTGTSGAASLSGGVLNIPQYSSGGSGAQIAGALAGTLSVPQLVSQYVPTFTSQQIAGTADSYATIQAAITAAIAGNQELYMPCGTFMVSAGLVASATNFRMRGCGNGTNGPPIQNTQISASGYGYSTLVIGTGTPWALPQGWIRDIILSGPGITNTGYASLQLNGAVEYLVMDVTGGADDMGFDLIGNCFGAMFINPVTSAFNTNIGINFRNGGQSGSDITVYNPWVHGTVAGIESAGSGGGYHVYGGQVAAEATSPTDTSGSIIVGKEYPSGNLGESSIDFFGTSFEPSNDVWVIRAFAGGRVACYDCSMNPTNGGTPAIGVYKNTNQQEGQLTLDSTALSGYFSNAQLLVVSGSTVGGAWLSERGTYSAGQNPTINGVSTYVSNMGYQSGITATVGTDRAGLFSGGMWFSNNSGIPEYSTNQGSTWNNFAIDPGVNTGDLYYHSGSGLTKLAANGTSTAEVLVSTGIGGTPTAETYACGAFNGGAGTSESCTWSTAPTAGMFIACQVNNTFNGATTFSMTDSASDVYVGYGSPHINWGNGYDQTFYFGPLTTTVTTTTVSASPTANSLALKCNAVTNVLPQTDGQSRVDATSGTTITAPAIVTTTNKDYIFCGAIVQSGTLTAGSGFTLGSTDYGADSANQYQIQTTAGSITPTITNSASTNATMTCSAFKSQGTNAPTLTNAPALSAANMTNFPAVPLVASEESVASSATPTFSISFRESTTVLTANITSFTVAAGAAGQEKTLTFCQNSTGGYTVAAPTNVHGFMTVGATASKCSSQHFTYNSIQTAWVADSPGVINQ